MADTQAPATDVTGQAPAVQNEAEQVIQTPVPKQADPNDAFARREKALRRQAQQLEAEKKAWQAKQTDYETNYIPRSRLKDDTLEALRENGVDYNQLTEQILNAPNMNDPVVRAMYAKLKAIEDKQAKSEQAAQQYQTQQYEQALKQISSEVKVLVSSNEAFEMIKEKGAEDAVVQLIEDTFNKDGYLMDIDKAAQEVEEWLLNEYLNGAKLKKVQAKLKPDPVPESPKPKEATKGITTITNRMSQEQPKKSSDKEKRERAMAAFYGKLNT